MSELSSQYSLHPTQIGLWKKHLLETAVHLFQEAGKEKRPADRIAPEQLYQQIGELQVELNWLKKNLATDVASKRNLINTAHPHISVVRQCELLGLNRSSYKYQPLEESTENLQLMRLIDEQYLHTPYYGVRKMGVYLQEKGYKVNVKKGRRLMRLMGLEAIYPKKSWSQPAPGQVIYPYLLKGMNINRVNQVWSTDITYIPMAKGFMYLAAIIDGYCRYVLSWRVSNSLEGSFCLEILEEALQISKPSIFNTDQGAPFTSLAFTNRLKASCIQISLDGRGRALDNIFMERLWRSVK